MRARAALLLFAALCALFGQSLLRANPARLDPEYPPRFIVIF